MLALPSHASQHFANSCVQLCRSLQRGAARSSSLSFATLANFRNPRVAVRSDRRMLISPTRSANNLEKAASMNTFAMAFASGLGYCDARAVQFTPVWSLPCNTMWGRIEYWHRPWQGTHRWHKMEDTGNKKVLMRVGFFHLASKAQLSKGASKMPSQIYILMACGVFHCQLDKGFSQAKGTENRRHQPKMRMAICRSKLPFLTFPASARLRSGRPRG